MTQAYMEQSGKSYLMRLEGHATGRTDVCAAVSCIAVTLAGYAVNAQERAGVTIQALEMGDGKTLLQAQGDEQFKGAFEAAEVGLLQLQRQFPQQIFVEIKKS